MDLQEAFNKIWQHFVVEKGRPSYDEEKVDNFGGFCAYRGKDGAKCAFGIFIPDEEYHESMEGKSSAFLVGQGELGPLAPAYPNLANLFKGVPWRDLQQLQKIHDYHTNEFVSLLDSSSLEANLETFHYGMKRSLESFAERTGVQIPK